MAQSRGLTKLGLRRIAPTVLISTAPPEETLSALRTAGYAPTQEAETGTTVLDRAPTDRAPSLLPSLDQAHPLRRTTRSGCPFQCPKPGGDDHRDRVRRVLGGAVTQQRCQCGVWAWEA